MAHPPSFTWNAFDGQWLPDLDASLIGPKNYKTLKNLRYTDASLEGVAGYSKINTTALSTYLKIRSGIHFKKDQPDESHVIVQTYNTGLTASVIYQNETAIPSQGDFNATALHTDASGAGQGRFSKGPRGTVLYCNGKETMIWGGNESPVSALITSTAAITNSITNPRDFTEKVQNTLQNEQNLALIGGGKDSTTVLLLHGDGADASTTITESSDSGHTVTANGNAQIDVAQAVFGSGSILFDGTGDYLSIPDHANWNFGTGTLTMDFRVRFNAISGMSMIWLQKDATNGDHIALWVDHEEGKIHFQVMDGGVNVINEAGTWAPSTATWYHVAVVRGWGGAADDWAICVDGTAIHTFTDSGTMPDHNQVVLIGGNAGTTYAFDYTARNPVMTWANGAAISAAAAKFGRASIAFDGTDDYISIADSADWEVISQTNFTIDLWVKHGDHAGSETYVMHYTDGSNFWAFLHEDSGGNDGLRFIIDDGGGAYELDFYGGEIEDTDWHHIAVCKVGSDWGIYKDGTQVAYASYATPAYTHNQSLNIGRHATSGWYFQGSMDDIRVTQGNEFSAAPNVGMTDTITVPTVPHSNSANAKLVLRADASDFNGWLEEFRVKKASAAWTANFTLPVRAYTDQALYWVVGSTRPLKGVKAYVANANTESAPTITGTYWNGYSWTSLTTFVDNTSGLTASGTMTWDSTVNTAKPKFLNGYYLYFYQFQLSAGSADLYYFTVDTPFQNIVDIWDGVYRQPVAFQASRSSVYEDYTLEVNTPSTVVDPIAATIGGLTNTDHVIIGFEERTTAIKFQMIAGKTNSTNATTAIYYWDGSAWVSVGSVVDLTLDSGSTDTLNQTGVMSWTPPDIESEFPQELFGVTGFFYKLMFSATLTDGTDHDGTSIGIITGIPAQQKMNPYKFPSTFKNMVMLCGITESNEGNRVDFSMPNAPDVYNGELSSMGGLQSLYFGGEDELTAAVELYNRFGSNIFTTWIAFKATETYLLTGDSPEDFKIDTLSHNIGCPAPFTLATAETGYEFAEEAQRNIAIWLSNAGPMIFDGAVFVPLKGVDTYFDPQNSNAINMTYIERSIGWFDPIYKEYNLLIPTGASTTCNTWLVYDLIRKRWYEKNTGAASIPQAAFPVVDTYGKRHVYGTIDTGYMMRLEYGTAWDSTAITYELETGDFFPADSPWVITQLQQVKLAMKRITEEKSVTITHYPDTSTVTDGNWTMDAYDSGSDNRVVRTTEPKNFDSWAHRLKFSIATSSTAKGFQPYGWGFRFSTIRNDTNTGVTGAMATPYRVSSKSSNYTISADMEVIFATGDITITLASAENKYHSIIINEGGGNVEYRAPTGETVEGDQSRILTKQYEVVKLIGNGSSLYAEI